MFSLFAKCLLLPSLANVFLTYGMPEGNIMEDQNQGKVKGNKWRNEHLESY